MIQLKKLDPMEVLTRNLLIADLATIPPELIAKVAPEIVIEMEHQMENDNKEITTTVVKVINWATVLFKVNTPRLEFILSHYYRKDQQVTEEELAKMKENAENMFNDLAGNPKPTKEDTDEDR